MTAQKSMVWIFGVGFWVMFITLQFVLIQRDDARQYRAQFNDMQMVCRMVKS